MPREYDRGYGEDLKGKIESEFTMEAIPEAITYKQSLLRLMSLATRSQAMYYMGVGQLQMTEAQLGLQGCVIALYTTLKVKLNKKEKKDLAFINEFINSVNGQRKIEQREMLNMGSLNFALDVIVKVIERMGITKIEKKKYPETESMA